MTKTLVIVGVFCIVAGLLWPWLKNFPIGRLPGDFVVEREQFRFYFPLTTSILFSILLTLLYWFFRK